MTTFEQLEAARELLAQSEDIIRGLRDQVDTKAQRLCNAALGAYAETRDLVWLIDKELEGGNT